MTTRGIHGFDFLLGTWNVRNRKILNNKDPRCEEWIEFEAVSDVTTLLHGFGNLDRYFVPDSPAGEAFEAVTLRLFDPSSETWQIWWSSTRSPGVLDPPVKGHFEDGHGVFDCHDVIDGTPVEVRFEWTADATSPVWRQSFSWDAGVTWKKNWTMDFSRIDQIRG